MHIEILFLSFQKLLFIFFTEGCANLFEHIFSSPLNRLRGSWFLYNLRKLRQRDNKTYPKSFNLSVAELGLNLVCQTPKLMLYIEENTLPELHTPEFHSCLSPGMSWKPPSQRSSPGTSFMIYLSPASLIYRVLVMHRGKWLCFWDELLHIWGHRVSLMSHEQVSGKIRG